MLSDKNKENRMNSLFYYLAGMILCLLTMVLVLKLWNFKLSVPYIYDGDGMSTSLFIKGMIDNGWYNINRFVGAPFGLEMYDYPLGADNLQYFIMKLISIFKPNYVYVMNMYYLLTYPLVMLTTLYVFRSFKVNLLVSIMGSLLYTFVPYHLIRTGHLFLIGYYLVPLIIMIIIWISTKEDILIRYSENNNLKLSLKNKSTYVCILVCCLISTTGAYYAFFSCVFMIIMGIFTTINQKKLRPLIVSISLISIIAISLFINLSPNYLYKVSHGVNPEMNGRSYQASETYGMKIVQLLLPITNHRIHFIAAQKEKYNNGAPLVNENDTASLGALGSFGFLALLAVFLFIRNNSKDKITQSLGLLNISAVLLGTIGGFGTVFAILVSPQLRGYNRVSIFIAFYSFLIIGIFFTRFYNKYGTKFSNKLLLLIGIAVIGVGALFDQTRDSLPSSQAIQQEYNSDHEFIQKISQSVKPDSMIFQLPYIAFPEGGQIKNLNSYDLFKGYLHSDNIRWSFGDMKGREGDLWQREVVNIQIDKAVEDLSLVGYSGIYIDRFGYSNDYDIKLEKKLSEILGVNSIISSNNRMVYYSMEKFNQGILTKYSTNELNSNKSQVFNLVKDNTFPLDGSVDWEFVKDFRGYKAVQFTAFPNMGIDQNKIKVFNKKDQALSFDDSFNSANKYSFRHWENPKHFILTISDKDSGWSEEYKPSTGDIKAFFNSNPYRISYSKTVKTEEIMYLQEQ